MSAMIQNQARAMAEMIGGAVHASVEIAAPPERVFRAISSSEITQWWVRPGVFDTREWSGEVRVGGRWTSTGIGQGRPYSLEGEFLEVDPPRKLVHTWTLIGMPGTTTVTYLLEKIDGGTRLTLTHSGFNPPAAGTNSCIGWETSFVALADMLAK